MKTRLSQTLIVICLMLLITGIAVYSWTTLLDLMDGLTGTVWEKMETIHIW